MTSLSNPWRGSEFWRGKVTSMCCRVGKFLAKVVNQKPNTRHFTKKLTFLFVPWVSCTLFLMKTSHNRQIFPKHLPTTLVSSKMLGKFSPFAPLIFLQKPLLPGRYHWNIFFQYFLGYLSGELSQAGRKGFGRVSHQLSTGIVCFALLTLRCYCASRSSLDLIYLQT